jgi:hypothetical protein
MSRKVERAAIYVRVSTDAQTVELGGQAGDAGLDEAIYGQSLMTIKCHTPYTFCQFRHRLSGRYSSWRWDGHRAAAHGAGIAIL